MSMTPTNLPRFVAGMKWKDVSVSQLNDLVALVTDMASFLGGLGFGDNLLTPSHARKVAVVEVPVDGQDIIRVRAIRYAGNVPVPGQFEWDQAPFDAYPEVGFLPGDFTGSVWVDTNTDQSVRNPTLTTPMFDAHFHDKRWFVRMSAQSSPIRLVVVRDLLDVASKALMVQEVTPHIGADGQWDGTFDAIENAVEVNVWPGLVAADYTPFLWQTDVANEATILALDYWAGSWWCRQQPKWKTTRVRGPIKLLDCAVAGG